MQRLWSILVVGATLWLSAAAAFALEFSAEQTTRKGAQSMSGKVYFQSDRWRMEIESPDGPKVAIHRLDKAVTWLLLPNRTYVEIPLRFDQVPQWPRKSKARWDEGWWGPTRWAGARPRNMKSLWMWRAGR